MKYLRIVLTMAMTIITGGSPPLLVQFSAVSSPNPSITVETEYYDIVGSTKAQLRSQINQIGAIDPRSGQRFAARTDWNVQWHYHYRQHNQTCSFDQVQVSTTVKILLPRWRKTSFFSVPLWSQWRQYMIALKTHEMGHQQNGIQAGQEILQALQSMASRENCQQLSDLANQQAQAIIRKYNQSDILYDQQTKHGLIQGAVF